jgi:hypothetical protein
MKVFNITNLFADTLFLEGLAELLANYTSTVGHIKDFKITWENYVFYRQNSSIKFEISI